MPEGVDPDDFVRTQGAEAFRALVESARPMLDHLIQQSSDDATIPGKAETARRVVEVLAKVKNPLVRDLYQRELAAKLGVPATHVARMVRDAAFDKRTTGAQTSPQKPAVQGGPSHEPPRDEIDLLTLLVNRPELATSDDASRALELLVDPDVRQFYRMAMESARQGERMDVPTWLDTCPAETRAAIGAAVMDGRWDKVENTAEALHALVGRLERSRLEAEIGLAKRQREEALARGDEEEARAISVREMELIRSKLGLAN
jgi:DNA primase